MADRKTAAQRLEDRFNIFLSNEFLHLSVKVGAIDAQQKVLMGLAVSILAAVIATIALTIAK